VWAGQLQCGGDGDRFGRDRDAGQPEPGGDFAIVGDALAGEKLVLRPQAYRVAESGGVLHGAQQQLRVDDRMLGLREGDTAGARQGVHFGQFLARQLLGQRADRIDPRQAKRFAAPDEALDEPRFIERRLGVGRAGE
jgi:hypothetical protein